MKRREFITLIGGAAVAWPLAARAQQPERMRRISVLMITPKSDPEGETWVRVFREELQKLGWTEGRNTRTVFAGRRQTLLLPPHDRKGVGQGITPSGCRGGTVGT